MISTPGKLHVDGYRPSNYSCPKRRNTKGCDNQTINDSVLGEFVINYILNMLNAKKDFSSVKSPEELERRLLFGSTFSGVEHIEENGLHEFYNLLARYGSDSFSIRRPRKKKAAVAPEVEQLRKEKERQERAMQRLQELYLYSESAMSEKDFIVRKA